MIRKAAIVVLTLGAVAVTVESLRSSLGERVFHGFTTDTPSMAILCGGAVTTVFFFVTADPQAPDVQMSFLWFGLQRRRWYDSETNAYQRTSYVALCPSVFAVCILAAYPTIAFIRGPLRRWRRRKRGECVNCSYNLTGNVTGVCSECGTKIESTATMCRNNEGEKE